MSEIQSIISGESYLKVEPLQIVQNLKNIKKAQSEWADTPYADRIIKLKVALLEIEKLKDEVTVDSSSRFNLSAAFAKKYIFLSGMGEAQGILSQPETKNLPLGLMVLVAPGIVDFRVIFPRLINALLFGNAVIVKGSRKSPKALLKVIKILSNVLPKGVVSLVFGDSALTEFLASHPGVNAFHFTGKGSNAKVLLNQASQSFKRISFSLDGKGCALILDDSWLRHKEDFFASIHEGRGLLPWSTTRVFVLENQADSFLQEFEKFNFINSGVKITKDLDMCSDKQQYPLSQPEVLLNFVKYPADMVKWVNTGFLGLSNSIWCSDNDKFGRLAMKLNCGKVYKNQWMPLDTLPWGAKHSSYGEDPRLPSSYCQPLDF